MATFRRSPVDWISGNVLASEFEGMVAMFCLFSIGDIRKPESVERKKIPRGQFPATISCNER
jgi:hypothetical protein